MGLKFAVGDEVTYTPPAIKGKVLKQQVVRTDIQVLIEYEGAGKEMHRRWFLEQELEVVAKPEEAAAEELPTNPAE